MSSVQFNLLPDVKQNYIKAQRTRNLVVGGTVLMAAISVGIFILLFLTADVIQKKQLSDANKKVKSAQKDLQAISGLSEVLTVQNQLKSLVNLHQDKHISSRVFSYLPMVTPKNVNIGKVKVDFTTNVMQIDGTADSQQTVNTFIDTMKFTTYKVGSAAAASAFPSVIESSLDISSSSQVSYSLTVQFDPKLFANNSLDGDGRPQTPKLTVPSKLTTNRSANDPANVLFNGQTGPESEGQ